MNNHILEQANVAKMDSVNRNCIVKNINQCNKHKNPTFCKKYVETLCLRQTYSATRMLLNGCRGVPNCISSVNTLMTRYLLAFKKAQKELIMMRKSDIKQTRANIKQKYSKPIKTEISPMKEKMLEAEEQWIQKAFRGKKEGHYHKILHVAKDKKIPMKKLEFKKDDTPKERKMKNFLRNVKKIAKKRHSTSESMILRYYLEHL